MIYTDVAQFGRALGLGPRCRRFKSCHPYHLAGWKLPHAILSISSCHLLSYLFRPVITTRMKLKPQNKGFTINPSVLFTW